MNLKEVISFSKNIEYVFISTSGKEGVPVIDTVKTIELISGNKILIKEWLCDCTAINLNENKNCNLLAWDEETDAGYQLTGKVSEMQTLAFLEGYEVGQKDSKTLPQVLWRIIIDIESVGEFSHAPKERIRVITKDVKTITDRIE